jgi:hypothetical protein
MLASTTMGTAFLGAATASAEAAAMCFSREVT